MQNQHPNEDDEQNEATHIDRGKVVIKFLLLRENFGLLVMFEIEADQKQEEEQHQVSQIQDRNSGFHDVIPQRRLLLLYVQTPSHHDICCCQKHESGCETAQLADSHILTHTEVLAFVEVQLLLCVSYFLFELLNLVEMILLKLLLRRLLHNPSNNPVHSGHGGCFVTRT